MGIFSKQKLKTQLAYNENFGFNTNNRSYEYEWRIVASWLAFFFKQRDAAVQLSALLCL